MSAEYAWSHFSPNIATNSTRTATKANSKTLFNTFLDVKDVYFLFRLIRWAKC